MPKSVNVLFVTWDGPQSSYVEGLFLPIFRRLSKHGFNFHILQFTWGDKRRRLALKNCCAEQYVSYRDVSVLRHPIGAGSLVSAVAGARSVRKAIHDLRIDIVMPRSTLPAFAAILALRHLPAIGLLFDADGLPHDERVEFNGWSADGIAYRLLRDLEAFAVRRSDAVVTRSKKAIDILIARAGAGIDSNKFFVVSNGRNEDLFTPTSKQDRLEVRQSLGIGGDSPLLVFVGSSIAGKYCGMEMFEFFRMVRVRRKDAHMLILTGSPQEVNNILCEFKDIRSSCIVLRVTADDVPRYLCASDLGLAFIRPSFSMQAAAAIKLGEYLLCGLPVLTTRFIGDTDEIMSQSIGYSLDNMFHAELEAAADWFINNVLSDSDGFRLRCRDVGVTNFGLISSVAQYAKVLDRVSLVCSKGKGCVREA